MIKPHALSIADTEVLRVLGCEVEHMFRSYDFFSNIEFFNPHTRRKRMKIRPLQDRILVKRLDSEEKTAGGIIIPDNAKEKPMEGEVIAIGNGKKLEDGSLLKPDVKVGDQILFSKYAGSEVKIDGHEHLVMREDDILGVLQK